MLGIDHRDQQGEALAFIHEFDLSFPSGADPTRESATAFGLFGFPTTYFIEQGGHIHATKIGEISAQDLENHTKATIDPGARAWCSREDTSLGTFTMSKRPRNQNRTPARKPTFWSRASFLVPAGFAIAILLAVPLLRAGARGDAVPEFMHLHGLAIAPWAPDDLFVSSHQGLIRVDADGEWRFVSEERHDFMGFQMNPTEENVLYSSGHPAPGSRLPNPVGFMVSADAGRTWSIRSLAGEIDFHVMAVQPTNGDVIYGLTGGLMRSLDAGETWEPIRSPQMQDLGDVYGLAIGSDDADTVWLGTGTGLWQSDDAGRTWTNRLHGAVVTAITFGHERMYAYVVDRGLASSNDGGETWTDRGLLVEGRDAVAYIAPHPHEEDGVTVGTFGQTILRTTDGGRQWTTLAEGGVPQEHDHGDHEH